MTRHLLRAAPALLLAAALALTPPAQAAVQVGQPAPRFQLKDQQGKLHRLRDYRGKVVVLEWTNPQCPFVQRHYRKQTMKRLAQAHARRKVVWLAVNSSHFNEPAHSRVWTMRQRLPYPTLQDRSGTTGRAYGARTTPQLFVIGPEGRVRYAGAIDDDPHGDKPRPKNYVAAALGAVLGGKQPAPASTKPYGCSVKYKR